MKAIAIALTNLKRFFRERSNLFFVFIFPLALILVFGSAFGGDLEPRLGVVVSDAGPDGAAFVDDLKAVEGLTTTEFETAEAVTRSVERGELEAAVILPDGYSDDLRNGRLVTIEFLSSPDGITPLDAEDDQRPEQDEHPLDERYAQPPQALAHQHRAYPRRGCDHPLGNAEPPGLDQGRRSGERGEKHEEHEF